MPAMRGSVKKSIPATSSDCPGRSATDASVSMTGHGLPGDGPHTLAERVDGAVAGEADGDEHADSERDAEDGDERAAGLIAEVAQ